MSKHINMEICPSCEDKLKEAHPDIAKWFRDTIKPKYIDAHISWSYRDEKNQNECVKQGKSKLKFPLSAHNKCDDQNKPYAHALDLFQLLPTGIAVWVWKYFAAIAEVSKDIQWGGEWKTLGDADHFELPNN